MNAEEKTSKGKFYKKLWFWIVVLLFALVIVFNSKNTIKTSTSTSSTAVTSNIVSTDLDNNYIPENTVDRNVTNTSLNDVAEDAGNQEEVSKEALTIEDSSSEKSSDSNNYLIDTATDNTVQQSLSIEQQTTEDVQDNENYETKTKLLESQIAEEPNLESSTVEKQVETKNESASIQAEISSDYVLNKNTKKFHKQSCSSVGQIKDSHREDYSGTRQEIIDKGYVPCKKCNP